MEAQGGQRVTRLAFAALLASCVGCKVGSSRGGFDSSPSTLPTTESAAGSTVAPAVAPSVPAVRATPAAFPDPLISRGKPVFATSLARFAHPEAIDDGVYNTFAGTWSAGLPSPSQPAIVAIRVGAGARRVMAEWSAGGNYNYTDTEYGSPGSYRIETSGDSKDGFDGTWALVATNPHCTVRTQAHVFEFAGKSWVRMVVTDPPPKSPNSVQLDENRGVRRVRRGERLLVLLRRQHHGARLQPDNTHVPAEFRGARAREAPRYFPAVINGGIGGDRAQDAAARLDGWLALNPDMHFWAIAFGTNDAAGNNQDTSSFRQHLSTVIARVQAAGHVPILAKIPYASDGGHEKIPKFNEVIAELTADNGLLAGRISTHGSPLIRTSFAMASILRMRGSSQSTGYGQRRWMGFTVVSTAWTRERWTGGKGDKGRSDSHRLRKLDHGSRSIVTMMIPRIVMMGGNEAWIMPDDHEARLPSELRSRAHEAWMVTDSNDDDPRGS